MQLIGAFLLGRFASAPMLEAMRSTLAEVSMATLKARTGAVLGADVRHALSKVRVPALYLRATEDRLVPRGCANAIASAIAQTHIVDVEAPHFLLQAAPVAAAAAVRTFIETLPQAPAAR